MNVNFSVQVSSYINFRVLRMWFINVLPSQKKKKNIYFFNPSPFFICLVVYKKKGCNNDKNYLITLTILMRSGSSCDLQFRWGWIIFSPEILMLLVIHGRCSGILKTWLVYATVHHLSSQFIKYQNKTAMFVWSGCFIH